MFLINSFSLVESWPIRVLTPALIELKNPDTTDVLPLDKDCDLGIYASKFFNCPTRLWYWPGEPAAVTS